jgi:o-succinylbenzoate---CoA ligase
VSADEDDVLLVKGASLAKGYALRAPDSSWCWEAIQPEAGLRTRDRVSLSAHEGHHYLAFLGRDSSFVKILGELVNLSVLQRHLDDALLQTQIHCGAILVPLPDARRETRLVLVHAKGAMDAAERESLLVAYHSLCQPFEHVSEFIEVPEIPRSNLGKVRMEALREMMGEFVTIA